MKFLRIPFLLAVFILPDLDFVNASNLETVKSWANSLGDELWSLSEALTKSSQIKTKYKQMNASVKKKNGTQILDSSLRSVSTMLNRKINAVKCIHAAAEKLAEEYDYEPTNQTSYCSAKYSTFIKETGEVMKLKNVPRFAKDNPDYMEIHLEEDSHFYDISVNTNRSCVHVPTNIFYKEKETLNAILWSKGLNEVFINNYKSDPSLSWQYFGSSHGILRFYPAMQWNTMEVDVYDCRVQSWYIEAATCSKDVIILFDVSGSMTGFKNFVARRTLRSLLDTLSNNDFVNVYTFKNETKEVVDCFKGLVQATPENKLTIRNMLEPIGDDGKTLLVPLEGYGNLTTAYIKAFKTLKEKRKKCDVSSTQGCNQLVMLITDYVPGNLTEVFDEYNREVVNNETYIPVRVFTYLIGKEVTNVQEIQWMACLNRGYYVHIHSVEEVQQQVLKYINVIARPMILSGADPPPTWTHASIDPTRTTKWMVSGDCNKPDEDKLVTSVAIPAFDYKYNLENNDAILLGVAGTDVPIDSIAKLAQPHQLGVNGYSFIVSNNGYLLLHPLLITSINKDLQENYNSVDFVEVEQVDDGKGSRELGDKIKELRKKLVQAEEGSEIGVAVLFHYDSMRRLARVEHDYFFNQLVGTPFSMGISLPRGYGDTELLLRDNPLEVKHGQGLTGINVTDYFRFSYRVHPDWVYCKYHYLEGHESDSPEEEIWNFLVRISKKEIDITRKQYIENNDKTVFRIETHCKGHGEIDKDDYYCNEDLVKQLVFDAKLTVPYFKTLDDQHLAKDYNVNVRFIATSSGLTRWHYVFDESKNEVVDEHGERSKNYSGNVFGDTYILAIEETWYKAAVLQHLQDKESLVIASPLPVLDETIKNPPPVINEDNDVTLTASYAIFYRDGESETPASVVGFQFTYTGFMKRFMNIVDRYNNKYYNKLKCDDTYECYVIDSSGYVVLSDDIENVGTFFGVINSLTEQVLQAFLDDRVFQSSSVYNYQALCKMSDLKKPPSSAWSFDTPFSLARNLIRWILVEAFIVLSDFWGWNNYGYASSVVVDEDYIDLINQAHTESPTTSMPSSNDTIEAVEEEEKLFSCDHDVKLYILNQSYFAHRPVVGQDHKAECHPPYWAALIQKTNLLLVVIEKVEDVFNDTCEKPRSTKPIPTDDSTTSMEPCHKLDLGNLHRRRLEGCFTYDEKERNITACGLGNVARPDLFYIASTALLAMIAATLLS